MSSEMILFEVAPQTPRKVENKLKNEFVYSLPKAEAYASAFGFYI
jgi:hypothetical protein